jgi:hypothetical protein
VGSAEVQWKRYVGLLPEWISASEISVKEYQGSWKLPVPIPALPEETVKALPDGPVEHESMLEEADPASFAVAITRDVM